MSQPRYSRQLSGRVEVEFHHHPNRFRRFTWWTALACVIAAGVWLVQAGTRGENRIYEAGAVSTPHAMFENECQRCHIDNWAPVQRLTSFTDQVHSVSNEKCIACHMGTLHHQNQVPVHGDGPHELSCAKCHREHKGDEQLARVTDRHCTDCHGDLETSPGVPTFDKHVWSFEDPIGHPNFKIEELLKKKDDNVTIAKGPDGQAIHHAFRVLGYFARPGEEAHWQDKARIRFNHKAHLKAMFDAKGNRIKGDRQDDIRHRGGEKDGEFIGYPTSCMDCHEFDVERRYMKPIVYEKHCQECHPLTFDVDKFAEQIDPVTGEAKKVAVTVPHDRPDVVRGYLSKVYTIDALKLKTGGEQSAEDDPLAELRRGFPGRDFEASFNAEEARKIRAKLGEQEKALYPLDFVQNELARREGQKVLFKENGACASATTLKSPRTTSRSLGRSWLPTFPNAGINTVGFGTTVIACSVAWNVTTTSSAGIPFSKARARGMC